MSAHIHRLDTACTDVSRARPAATGSKAAATTNPLIAVLGHWRDRMLLARHRRTSIAELSRLSDRQLHDIGVRREQIPEVVDKILRRQSVRDE